MDIKKYLRERTEKDAEALLTEADRIFCKQLAEQSIASNTKKKAEKKKSKKRDK